MVDLFLYIFGGIALAGAVGTVSSRHPISAAISLVFSFLAVACIYALLQAHLLAAVQVIVYVGAIMVLIVYTILLMDLRDSDFSGALGWPRYLAGVLGVAWAAAVWSRLNLNDLPAPAEVPETFGTVRASGVTLFTDYVLLFEVVAVLLLAAVIGALALAMRSTPPQEAEEESS